jgi:predicted transcriptional regulator
MKGSSGFVPRESKQNAGSVSGIFRSAPEPEMTDEQWMVTSMRMRKSVRTRLKIYALEHGTTMQALIDHLASDFLDTDDV